MTKKQFIAKLKRARTAVAAGEVHCQYVSGRCHHCALQKAGIFVDDYRITGVSPGYATRNWSSHRPHKTIIKLFDDSIAALEAGVQ